MKKLKSDMNTPVLVLDQLTKYYKGAVKPALKDVSFQVSETEKIGIVGANGSGKTTLFKLILHIIHPNKGQIRVLNNTDLEQAKQQIGFVSENQEGLENFTPDELFMHGGNMLGLPGKTIIEKKEELLSWCNLQDNRDQLIGNFSKGMIQRLQLGLALLHEPKLLILDEPMSGLDPAGQQDLKDLLHRLEKYTMLYSSHILHDIEDICDRVIFFHQGELVSDLKLSEQEQEIFQLDTTEDIFNILEDIEDVRIREVQNRVNFIRIEFKTRQGIFQNIITQCRKENVPVLRIKSKSILEDIYSKYIT